MSTRLLITGGATGLGKSVALTWAMNKKSAVKICIADINQKRGDLTVTELKALGLMLSLFTVISLNKTILITYALLYMSIGKIQSCYQ